VCCSVLARRILGGAGLGCMELLSRAWRETGKRSVHGRAVAASARIKKHKNPQLCPLILLFSLFSPHATSCILASLVRLPSKSIVP
jgi:hypothetical protein